MVFRKAQESEAETILALYRAVIGKPYCTWNEMYPGEYEIAEDLAAGSLYVLEEDHDLIGAISIVPNNELDDCDCWKIRENAREFARVVLRPDRQGKGLSACLVEGILQEMKKQGTASVHLAVAKENIPAQRLYQKTGFDFCGEAELYGHIFYLCEKSL